MYSIKPGKQRKNLFNAPMHKKRKWLSAHLEENLLLKYDKRAVSVIKGDTIKVMRGSFKGHEDKVASVNIKDFTLEIEGITMSKADGNKIAKPIHPSNVLITKLNLTDKWRRKKLVRGLSEDVKKEIEKEAEVQIKQVKEEEKRIAEEKALEQAEKEKEEQEEKQKEEIKQEPKTQSKQEPTEKKAEPKKAEPKKKTETVKKQTKPKKKTTKAPLKKTQKKEDIK